MLLNCILTKDNLRERRSLDLNEQNYTTGCGLIEDKDYLFVKCNFYGRIWSLISSSLGLTTASQSYLLDHLVQFGA